MHPGLPGWAGAYIVTPGSSLISMQLGKSSEWEEIRKDDKEKRRTLESAGPIHRDLPCSYPAAVEPHTTTGASSDVGGGHTHPQWSQNGTTKLYGCWLHPYRGTFSYSIERSWIPSWWSRKELQAWSFREQYTQRDSRYVCTNWILEVTIRFW